MSLGYILRKIVFSDALCPILFSPPSHIKIMKLSFIIFITRHSGLLQLCKRFRLQKYTELSLLPTYLFFCCSFLHGLNSKDFYPVDCTVSCIKRHCNKEFVLKRNSSFCKRKLLACFQAGKIIQGLCPL